MNAKPKLVRVDTQNHGTGWYTPAVFVEMKWKVKGKRKGISGKRYIFGKKGEEALSIFEAIKLILDLPDSKLVDIRATHATITAFGGISVTTLLSSKVEVIVEYKETKFTGVSVDQHDTGLALAEAFLDALWEARS